MDEANEQLLASFAEVRNHGAGREKLSPAQVVELLRGADGMLLLNGAHVDEITADAVRAAGSVRVAAVAHWWETFNLVVPGWRQAGVQVIDASDACSQAVAEWTLGAAIAGLRKFDVFDRQMKAGVQWPNWRGVARQLNGSIFGMVAVGRVGRYVVRYLKPFDVRVLAYDPGLTAQQALELGVELVDLPTLLRTSDVISLHAPVLPQTKAMIGARELRLIRDGALLLNCARAWLLDNDAFRREMATGRFRAYLDVYEPEPPPLDDVLRRLDNVVLTPHVAGTTDAMFLRCGRLAIEALRAALTGPGLAGA
jgi:phosphoglycerate dehydrogenase-like enzyme